MSLLHKLITAAREAGSTSPILRDLRSQFVIEEERPLYEFVLRHTRRHGQIPSDQTIRAAGFIVEAATEPASYYLDRIRQRFVYNAINERHPRLADAMRRRDTETCVAVLREMLSTIGVAGNAEAYSTLAAEASAVVEEFMARKFRNDLAGLTTGWPTLDRMTLGMMGGDLIVLAGRPSQGKSWLGNEICYNAWQAGSSVAAVSMEMGKIQFCRRWIGRHLGINPNFIRSGQLSVWTERMLRGYPDTISSMPGVYVVSGDMSKTVESLDPFIQETMPDLIFVDAAYLMSVEGRRKGGVSKWEMISEVIGGLKTLAIRYNRPVLITVQFNRNQRSSGSRRGPDLGDIAGSDSIPQDASIVLGVRQGVAPYEKVRRLISVMKNREGEVGEFETKFSFTPPNMAEVLPEEDQGTAVLDWMT